VNKDFPANYVRELIAYAKANPGKVNFASVGSGTAQHLASEIFKIAAGIDIVHVPYKGSAPAFTDLAGGAVQMLFDNIPASRAMIQAGKVKVLAVSTTARSSAMPEVPTVAESGLPGFDVTAWFGVFAPAGTPRPIVERLNGEIVRILALPEVSRQLAEHGIVPGGDTPEALGRLLISDIDRWGKVVREAGIRAE
jgi:tripartite-type tricarboxylate transporter receptor subunit TctC